MKPVLGALIAWGVLGCALLGLFAWLMRGKA